MLSIKFYWRSEKSKHGSSGVFGVMSVKQTPITMNMKIGITNIKTLSPSFSALDILTFGLLAFRQVFQEKSMILFVPKFQLMEMLAGDVLSLI